MMMMMKMRTLLLPSAVALLFHLAFASPHSRPPRSNTTLIHLNDIFKLADECKTSLSKPCEIFVEDVSDLTEGDDSCANAFFCKVQSILVKHKKLCNTTDGSLLMRHVRQYNHQRNVKCEETLRGLNSTSDKVCATKFLGNIRSCIQQKNWMG